MEATQRELETLAKLQEVDIAIVNAKRKLDNLPQRTQLQDLAQKKQAVVDKQAQVAKMHDAARRKLSQLEDEIDILSHKQEATQEKINEAAGDFRAVQSLTRDLGGIAKRLDTLEEELSAAQAKHEQVEGVKAQVEKAIVALDAQAFQLRDSFQKEAAELQANLDEATRSHAEIASDVSAPVLKAYDEACKRGGGVGLAFLTEGRCNTCRSIIDPNRLLIVKREAPLSRCPTCRRLLVVSE